MKKIIFAFISLAICAFLCGCSNIFSILGSTSNKNTPEYLKNISQQYEYENKQHTFFWQFTNKNDKVIKAAASVKITIMTDNDEEVFDKEFEVTEDDYSVWTGGAYPDGELLGSITIPDEDIICGTSENGKATITIEFDNGYFDPKTISVFNLPLKSVEIELPDLPAESAYFSYDGSVDSVCTVTDISYEYDYSLKIKFTAQMTYRSEESFLNSGYVGYKLTNQDGIIVEKGNAIFLNMDFGDTMTEEIYVYDVSPGDELILTITNTDF